MTEVTEAYEWRGREVVDKEGEKIGSLEEVYLDTDSGRPEWAAVNTGLFGMKQSFVPLHEASPARGKITVPYTKDQVKDAPSVDPDGELSSDEEQQLYTHYGIAFGGSHLDDGERPEGRDVSGPTTDDAMTRSEEELRVGTARRERGRARLRKYVITEQVQQTVPVQREEVRVEREPITDANVERATDGPAISDEEHEVVLHEEEVVTEKRAVPKERVRMTKDAVTDEETVSEEVRKERIEVDEDDR
ncbi:MAG TPA: PRC and DUF2382 domain-containing protein [Thermoleophilaceae bacterium]|nr:PRC and DUF2382 domain-containing protein [Thermoleophilaceae bacterium]